MVDGVVRQTRIDARIDARYADLSPQERRASDFLLEHMGDLAIYSAVEIARATGVSKATISRLFRKLGFDDFREVREHARELRLGGLPTASPVRTGTGDPGRGVDGHTAREHDNMARFEHLLSDGRLDEAVRRIATADRVVIVSLRNSYPVALHLHQQLIQARGRVRVAPQPGQSLGEENVELGERDVQIVIGFRRRPAVFERLIRVLETSPVQVIGIGDGTSRKYAPRTDCWLECPVDADGAFDSYATAMSLVGLLANRVLNERLSEGRTRIPAIAAAYDDLDELER